MRTGLSIAWCAFCQTAGETPLARGLEAFRQRDFAAAERSFQEAIRQQPSSARAHKLLGMTYATQDKYAQAQAFFERACTLDPKEEDACYYLGRTYFTLSRLEESLRAYRAAPVNGRVLLGMALSYEALNQPREAERCYKAAAAAGEKRALVDYGLFLFKQDRGPESLDLLKKAGARTEFERVKKALEGRTSGREGMPPPQVRFAITELDMIVRNGATGDKHLIETMIAGAAVFDYDNDGWPDIFIANGAAIPSLRKTDASFHNQLFRNNHDGTFILVGEKAGVAGQGFSMGAAAADYDNDGHVDLFVTGVGSNTLYRNRGDGSFEDVTARAGLDETGPWSVAAAWFDYDNDGLLDLFVVRYVVWDPATERYCGLEKPGYRQYCNPKQYRPLANALYHNQGDGTFRDVSRESGIAAHPGKGMGVAVGDYDGDGRLDVFVANDTMPNFLFHNEGGGTFRELALEAGVAYNDDGV
ncbi:MAG: VCBS repeat-containing protein, partial [Acidobacteria bacterium]|nr:VCBS repeat-containing protein [Acidobacteriota bacterium]